MPPGSLLSGSDLDLFKDGVRIDNAGITIGGGGIASSSENLNPYAYTVIESLVDSIDSENANGGTRQEIVNLYKLYNAANNSD